MAKQVLGLLISVALPFCCLVTPGCFHASDLDGAGVKIVRALLCISSAILTIHAFLCVCWVFSVQAVIRDPIMSQREC